MPERVGYLGLGSNVGGRASHLRAAIELLRGGGVEVEAVSSTYETEPVGEVLDQPEFLNAAVRIRTGLEPEPLLDLCKRVEVERGRALRRTPPQPAPARRRPPTARRPRARDQPPDLAAPRGDEPSLRPRPAARARLRTSRCRMDPASPTPSKASGPASGSSASGRSSGSGRRGRPQGSSQASGIVGGMSPANSGTARRASSPAGRESINGRRSWVVIASLRLAPI